MFNKTLRTALLGSGAAIAMMAGPAFAGQSEDLKAQIDTLQSRLDQLEKQTAATEAKQVAAPADAVVGGDYPGSFKLPGSDTSFSIHGYTKLDAIVNFDQNLGPTFAMSSIKSDNNASQKQDGQFNFHARQSRINFQSRTPTNYGQLKTFIEGDFFGAAGNVQTTSSHGFRLRHAYGELGPVLAGQTWSNFNSLDDTPETLDFGGGQGSIAPRQPQIRYTQGWSKFTFSGSVENPAGDITTATSGTTQDTTIVNRMPDITAHIRYNDSWGGVGAAGVLRYLGVDAGTTSSADDSTLAGGGVVSGQLNLSTLSPVFGKDVVAATAYYGSGIGRYLIGPQMGVGQSAISYVDGSGSTKVVTQSEIGGQAWILHHWTDQLRSTAVYGISRYHWAHRVAFSTTQTDYAQNAFVNLIWSPVKAVNIGIEYHWGQRVQRKNDSTGIQSSGQAQSLQVALQYVF
jgi:hypothetical protein